MTKNIIKEENFLSFLHKNKQSDQKDESLTITKEKSLLSTNLYHKEHIKITNNSCFPINTPLDDNRKFKIRTKILNSIKFDEYFMENMSSFIYKQQKQTLELKLERIERILGFHIYKLIHDLYDYTKINLKISEICKNSEIPSISQNFYCDDSKTKYFETLHEKIFKSEINELLNNLYDKSINIYESKLIKLDETTPKKQKLGVLHHSNSVTCSPVKSPLLNETPKTPEKRGKKVSFHEEVTVQIFSHQKSDIVTTVKKQDFKERKKKILSFLEFKEKKENENEVVKLNEGAKTLLKFINKNNLGQMENLNFLKNNLENKNIPENPENQENDLKHENHINFQKIENQSRRSKNFKFFILTVFSFL